MLVWLLATEGWKLTFTEGGVQKHGEPQSCVSINATFKSVVTIAVSEKPVKQTNVTVCLSFKETGGYRGVSNVMLIQTEAR